jgi:HEAT repeat protein
VAIAGLASVRADAALEPLLRALVDSDPQIRATAASALGRFSGQVDRILPLLQWRLTNDLPAVRVSAADGLAKFGAAAIIAAPELMRLYREERDGSVQVAIARALYAIAPQFAAQVGISPENFWPFSRRNNRSRGR